MRCFSGIMALFLIGWRFSGVPPQFVFQQQPTMSRQVWLTIWWCSAFAVAFSALELMAQIYSCVAHKFSNKINGLNPLTGWSGVLALLFASEWVFIVAHTHSCQQLNMAEYECAFFVSFALTVATFAFCIIFIELICLVCPCLLAKSERFNPRVPHQERFNVLRGCAGILSVLLIGASLLFYDSVFYFGVRRSELDKTWWFDLPLQYVVIATCALLSFIAIIESLEAIFSKSRSDEQKSDKRHEDVENIYRNWVLDV